MTNDAPETAVQGASAGVGMRGADARREVLHGLSLLIDKGLPLPPGLRAMAAETADAGLRRALLALAHDLEAGMGLREAVAAHSDYFPARWRALLDAGLRTGRLGELVAGLISDQDLGLQIKRQLRTLLFYPIVLLLLFVCVFLPILVVLGRNFGPIFRDFGIDLGWISAEFIGALERIGNIRPVLLLGPLAGLVIAFVLYRVALSPADRNRLKHSLPLFGPVLRYVSLSDFCGVLSWLLEAEIALGDALVLAADADRDPVLAESCDRVATDVRRGASLMHAFEGRTPFPSGFGRYVNWATTLRDPSEALQLASSIFAERARAQARFAATFLAVFAMAIVLTWCACGVFLIMWPMMRLLWVLTGFIVL